MNEDDLSERMQEIKRRLALKNVMGNLTILNREQNVEAGNKSFAEKREVYVNDVLETELTKEILAYGKWSEDEIIARGKSLFEVAEQIWPYPAEK